LVRDKLGEISFYISDSVGRRNYTQHIAFFDQSVANILISSIFNVFFNGVEKIDSFSIILLSHLQFIDAECALMVKTCITFHDLIYCVQLTMDLMTGTQDVRETENYSTVNMLLWWPA
jgi:hypothetical protein